MSKQSKNQFIKLLKKLEKMGCSYSIEYFYDPALKKRNAEHTGRAISVDIKYKGESVAGVWTDYVGREDGWRFSDLEKSTAWVFDESLSDGLRNSVNDAKEKIAMLERVARRAVWEDAA